MVGRLGQLISRYLGMMLFALAGYLGATEAEAAELAEHADAIAAAVGAMLLGLIDLGVHRLKTGGMLVPAGESRVKTRAAGDLGGLSAMDTASKLVLVCVLGGGAMCLVGCMNPPSPLKGPAQLLDTRTRDEHRGETPYFSARGGHIPQSHHADWRWLIDDKGLLPKEVLLRNLPSSKQPLIAYCTGGVRSAFVVAVLHHLGRRAADYDGSWWEWAGDDALPIATP